MDVGKARNIVQKWIMENASLAKNYKGAYFSGSVLDWAEDIEVPDTSDIDVMVVIDTEEEAPLKLGKFVYKEVLIEITYMSSKQLASVQAVLGNYHLASSFRKNGIINDPTGYLSELQSAIQQQFAKRASVEKRCQHAFDRIHDGLTQRDLQAPLHEQVTSWLFPTSIATHAILAAALRNPTTRTRYLAARKTLEEYRHLAIYDELLSLLGASQLTAQRAQYHLDQLAVTFDKAAEVGVTPFLFSSDITSCARKISIDGSRALILNGDHREAVFWIAATFARCHAILSADAAPAVQQAHLPAFEALLADLGIQSILDLASRSREALQLLPALKATTHAIIESNRFIN